MKDDLIGRLRVSAEELREGELGWPEHYREAADEIERLRARVAELEATVNEWAGV